LKKKILLLLLGLVISCLAGKAVADDDDPFAAQRKQTSAAAAQSTSNESTFQNAAAKPASVKSTLSKSNAVKPAPVQSNTTAGGPRATTSQQPSTMVDAALRPARFVTENPVPPEPLELSSPLFGSAGPNTGSKVINDSAVRAVQHLAEPPTPDDEQPVERDHFSGAESMGPPMEAEYFEDPYEVQYDPVDAPAPTTSSRDWVRNGRWYLEQSVVYMNRSAGAHNQIELAIDLTSSPIAHYQKLLDIPVDLGAFSPGYRSTIGRNLGPDGNNRDHGVEFTFLGMTHWRSAEDLTAVTPGGIFSLVDASLATPAFNASDSQSFIYTSTFNSYELNYRISRRPTRDQLVYSRDSTWIRQNTPSPLPSIFGGLRVVTVNEQLHYQAQSSAANGDYNVQTHNNLVGLQGGGDWFYQRPSWRLGMRVKGGMLVNWADQISQVQILDANGVPVAPTRDERANKNIAALLGEISFIGSYQITPRFGFRVSYDMMWVTNLALAQNQINFTPSDTGSQASFQKSLMFTGASFGFEINR
jgi:hypothetical protein